MVMKFVRDKYPKARFQRIYDAATDGWGAKDFHKCCDKKGWTLTVVETTKGFIFGGFTTTEWESQFPGVEKPSLHSFLFSVNYGSKYMITGGDKSAISCNSDFCALFGTEGNELVIWSDSNCNTDSYCLAKSSSFNLPASKGKEGPSMNGGEEDFKLK
jgi:hypothetical protein